MTTARPRPTAADFADATFTKSSRSGSGQSCLERAGLEGGWTGVRDSKEIVKPGKPPTVLVFGPGWPAFVRWAVTSLPS